MQPDSSIGLLLEGGITFLEAESSPGANATSKAENLDVI
jgi:hypothetical protein